jgi:hypothetical protein
MQKTLHVMFRAAKKHGMLLALISGVVLGLEIALL